MKLAEKEQVLSVMGKTTPFPKIDLSTGRKTLNTIKRIDNWLIDNAISEAKRRNDKFNLRQFECINRKNITQSDKDSANLYLFGFLQYPKSAK